MTISTVRTLPVFALALAACAAPRAPGPTISPAVELLTRAEWGANPPVLPMKAHEISHITIHHTATLQDTVRSLAEKMRGLQHFSQNDGKLATGKEKPAWADVPYHYYVDVHGRVAEGREVGYAGDTNTEYDPAGHVLIVLEGSFDREEPTPGQLEALRRLVVDFAARWQVPPERIMGHKDYASTACPGKNLEAYFPELRRLVASYALRAR